MRIPVRLERVAAAMSRNAPLAIVDQHYHELPWRAELGEVIARHSRSPAFDPAFSIAGALSAAGLFQVTGRAETVPTRGAATVSRSGRRGVSGPPPGQSAAGTA